MNSNLRTRILWLALLPGTLVAVLLTAIFLVHSIDSIDQGLRTRGKAIARQVAGLAEFGIFSGQRMALSGLAESAIRIDPEVRGAAIVEPGGEILARGGDLSPARWPDLGQIEGRRLGVDVLLFVEPVRQLSVPVDDIYGGVETPPEKARLLGYVVIELSSREIAGRITRLAWIALAVAGLGVALGGWLAWRIARSVTLPLLAANEVVARIGGGDLDARMSADTAGPLQSLAIGINSMAARIGLTQEDLLTRVAQATSGLQHEKDAAERATLAKSHFLAAASHDLRQPLHALGLFVAALAQSDAARREPALVGNIRSATDTLQNLLDAILDVSRLDSGKVVPRIAPIAIGPLFAHTRQALSLIAENKGLSLRARPSEAWVSCDREMLQRILLNLVGNAIRYTRSGGVLMSCRRRGDQWLVEVWDTGNGIPEHARDEIFEEYAQLENPERDRAKGLGLGLAICRRLAGLLAAPIGVRSRPGRGSVFWILLPAAAVPAIEQPSALPAESAEELARIDGSVLVIDADPMVRAGMETAIGGWGAKVMLAADGEEAWRCCEGGMRPDIAICNLGLPGRESGIDLVRKLQRVYPAMGVLLVSADTSEETQAAARAAGFPLLKQPLPPGRLRAALRTLLSSSS
ncbi:MAG: response regulator [Rhodocyclales bacterium]|nr:response regulator [Rhodocyclales bacterium]